MKTKILKNQRGTSIVEFAIILPLLIILIFGMVEFSVLFYDKAVLTNASREGARAGVVYNALSNGTYAPLVCSDGTTTGLTIENVVNTYLANHLITFGTPTAADLPICSPCTGSGAYLTIRVRYQYTFLLLPNFLNFLPSPFELRAETTMRCE